jgi:hypothetical protein
LAQDKRSAGMSTYGTRDLDGDVGSRDDDLGETDGVVWETQK